MKRKSKPTTITRRQDNTPTAQEIAGAKRIARKVVNLNKRAGSDSPSLLEMFLAKVK